MTQQKPGAIWAQQIRAPFLILSIVLVLIAIGAVFHHTGHFYLLHSLLLTIGVILAHISVNLFNELSDFQTKIDQHTVRTPFSGGSGMMQAKKTSPEKVKLMAYIVMLISAAIGIYFCFVSGWEIAIFMVIGAVAILFYTSRLAKWLLGELFSGMTLGSLVVLGAYYALTSNITLEIILISIPPGILTSLLLFLNEFPDVEADKTGGRHHLVIHFGRKTSAKIYVFFLGLVYVSIFIIPFISNTPKTVLLGLVTIPIAIKASVTTLQHSEDIPRLIPAMGTNVMVVIVTDLLLAIALFI